MPAKVSKHGPNNSNYKHGHARQQHHTRTYRIWAGMHGRCRRKTNKDWKYYGGRGIQVCSRWQSFSNFLADMGPRPAGLTLGRIDANGNYEPKNCEWQTWRTQNNTSRRARKIFFRGAKGSLKEICTRFGVDYRRAIGRIASGWSIERALAEPHFRQIDFRGMRGTLKELCANHGLSYNTVRARLRRLKWSLEKALLTPAKKP